MKQQLRDEIIRAVLELGKPSPIMEIERRVSIERHTLSKYLGVLQKEGILDYEPVGRAKLWFINQAPLEKLFNTEKEHTSFAERVLSAVLERMPAGLLVIDEHYLVRYGNTLAKSLYGDFEGKTIYGLLIDEENPLKLGPIREVLEGKKEIADMKITDTNGRILYLRGSPVQNPDGTRSVIVILDDITYENEFQQKLKESEENHRELVRILPDAMLVLDLKFHIKKANLSALRLLGVSKEEEILGKSLFNFAPEDSRAIVEQRQREMLAGRAVRRRQYTLISKSGERILVEVSASVIRDGSGKATGFITLFRPMEMASAYAERLQQLGVVVDSADEAIISITLDGIVTSWNPAATRIYGYEEEEMLGKSVEAILPEECKGEFSEMLERVTAGERFPRRETTRLRKDGVPITVSLAVSPLRDAQGRITGAASISHDVTERSVTERELRRLAAIVRGAQVAIIGKRLDGTITSWNKAAQAMYGYEESEVLGRNISLLIPEERKEELEEVLSKLRRGERIERLETERICKDGRRIAVSLTLSPIGDSSGTVVGASAIGRDITKEKDLERSAWRSEQRLRALIGAAPFGVYMLDMNANITFVSETLAKMIGYAPEQILGRSAFRFVREDEHERVRKHIESLIEKEYVAPLSYHLRTGNGNYVRVEVKSVLLRDEQGIPREICGTFLPVGKEEEREVLRTR